MMYSDRKKSRVPLIVCIALAAVIVVLVALWAFKVPSKDIQEDTAEAVRSAVERCALQCYVVEGVYPPDLRYLQDNYGLQVNTRDFYITYNAFSENLPPEVTVSGHKR
ncbi:MAG: hypothetical protein Q4A48_05890 [Bacillota bacterium]|nr:hypothetical protein [Bacillota bacterium]MDO4860537.1 hypothetical protein [Bacillota bacterium]